MLQLTLMTPSKVTDRKLRWEVELEDHVFQLYIPQWRVPRPWPKRILVSVSGEGGDATRPHDTGKPSNSDELQEPIVLVVKRVATVVNTVRFAPEGDPDQWEIGEPYIPFSLLP
jgi:hypothetical protein